MANSQALPPGWIPNKFAYAYSMPNTIRMGGPPAPAIRDPYYTPQVTQLGTKTVAPAPGSAAALKAAGAVGQVPGAAAGTPPAQDAQLSAFLASLKSQADAANAANEARFKQGMQMHDSRIQQATNEITGMGNSERARIEQDFANAAGTQTAWAASRGLANTGVLPSMQAGLKRQKASSLGELAERIAKARAGMISGLQGDQIGFLERKEEYAPDVNQYLALAERLGQGSLGQNATLTGGMGDAYQSLLSMAAPTYKPPTTTNARKSYATFFMPK